jgi:hypothetical protein
VKLGDIIRELDGLSDDLCIVARRPWGRDADAMLVRLTEEYRVPSHVTAAGYEYFLEVSLIREEVLGSWGSRMTGNQRFDVVLHYAEHDAWPDWFHEFCQANPHAGS